MSLGGKLLGKCYFLLFEYRYLVQIFFIAVYFGSYKAGYERLIVHEFCQSFAPSRYNLKYALDTHQH